MNELREIPLWMLCSLAAGLLLQGTFLFRDARKRGKKAWFWGLWGMVSLPMPTVVYCLTIFIANRRNSGWKK